MADSIQGLQPRVLHITPLHDDVSLAISDAIGRVGLETADCEDVYRGLARLAFWGADLIVGIVVHVDPLSAFEFEFFELAVARVPTVPIFVYGASDSRTRIETALRLGANREVNEATIGEALSRLIRQPSEASVVQVAAAAGERARAVSSAGTVPGRKAAMPSGRDVSTQRKRGRSASPPDASESEPQRLRLVMPPDTAKKRGKRIEREPVEASPTGDGPGFDDDSEDDFDDDLDRGDDTGPASLIDDSGGVAENGEDQGPARVPWRRYGDRPKRIPPNRTVSGGEQSDGDEPLDDKAGDDAIDEPLLGPEEIALLFGEDERGIDEQDDED